jgi:hypothetical protein
MSRAAKFGLALLILNEIRGAILVIMIFLSWS